MAVSELKLVVTYERVSSEDQRERETIKTQTESLAASLKADLSVKLLERYADEGVSGTVPLKDRPAGSRLLRDANRGLFAEIWVYKLDRLARDVVDALMVRRELNRLGIKVVAVCENIEGELEYNLRAVLAEEEKRTFLVRSSAGMNRAARDGRYCGGIVPLGYVVEGKKQHAYLAPSGEIIWGEWTEAELVRNIYHWLAIEGWSCRRIATHLNSLGVPTAYGKDGKLVKIKLGQRKERTQGVWRPGRIRNLVKNPTYKGEIEYGKRSIKNPGREVISASGPALVSKEIWQAAQETLSGNRLMAKNTKRHYLLKSVIKCRSCGLTYIGNWGRGFHWYRCNGRLTDRGPIPERCLSKPLNGPDLDAVVWDDVERFLRDSGALLDERKDQRDPGRTI